MPEEYFELKFGLSKRDWLAAKALPAVIQENGVRQMNRLQAELFARIAAEAYGIADAMMEESEKTRD